MSTANSSFIFDLRRRSITLCAVFLAIFFPAALVELGCFLPAAFDDALVCFFPYAFGDSEWVADDSEDLCCCAGFICIIFRERVGGGGSEKSGFSVAGRIGCGLDTRPLLFAGAIAGEGNVSGVSRTVWEAGSLPGRSKDEAGVRGKLVRGIV